MAIWHKEVSEAIDAVVDNPDIVALYRRWIAERDLRGAVPESAIFDANGPLQSMRDNLMMLEADGDNFVYRHYGAAIAGPLGASMVGRFVTDFNSEVGAFFQDCYRRTLLRRQPMYTVHFASHAPSVLTWERLILPLKDGDGRDCITAYARPLESRHELLEAVLNVTRDAILALRARRDNAGERTGWLILVANSAFARIMGVDAPDLSGRTVTETFDRWPALAMEDDCRNAMQSRTSIDREVVIDIDGEPRCFAVVIGPLGDGCVVHLTDVTALKRAEQVLRQQTTRLKLDNQQLESLASKDGLTGLANRRAFDVFLEREMAHARRTGEALALAICDIDNFKAYNDCYGHLAGDDVICEVAAALSTAGTRATDLVARFGGEEFVLVMRQTSILGGLEVLCRAQDMLLKRAVKHAASPTAEFLTLSFGLAEFSARIDADPLALVDRADAALYRAKQNGRNRIEVAE